MSNARAIMQYLSLDLALRRLSDIGTVYPVKSSFRTFGYGAKLGSCASSDVEALIADKQTETEKLSTLSFIHVHCWIH